MRNPIRVVMADDHPLIRAGIRTILSAVGDVVLIGEATNGYEAQQLCREHMPNVLLLDLNMPGPSSAKLVADLRAESPEVQVIILTAYDDDTYVRRLVASGAMGYVLKDEVEETVVVAIRTVVTGNPWFSPRIMDKLVQRTSWPSSSADTSSLSGRDLELLQLLVAGKTNQNIGQILGISVKTVEKHLGMLFAKLGVASRVEAAVHAVQHGLVPPLDDAVTGVTRFAGALL